MSVVCVQVEVSATGRSLVRRSPTDCVSVMSKPQQSGGLGPLWAVAPRKKIKLRRMRLTGHVARVKGTETRTAYEG